jgi:hypothetical protein
MTSIYFRQLDHVMEDCPQLIMKWKENRNENVHMIVVEAHDEQPKIVVVTHRGTKTRTDVTDQGNRIHQ